MMELSFEEVAVLVAIDQAMPISVAAGKAAELYPSTKFDDAVARETLMNLVNRRMLVIEDGRVEPTMKGLRALRPAKVVLEMLTRSIRSY